MRGDDDDEGEDEDLTVVHRVVHIRPVSRTEKKYFCSDKAVKSLFM